MTILRTSPAMHRKRSDAQRLAWARRRGYPAPGMLAGLLSFGA